MTIRPALIAFLVFLALPVAAADSAATHARGAMAFEPCTLAAVGMPVTVSALCGTLAVPEDRAQPSGRRITLAIAIVPSRTKQPKPDPVFMLAGGPGQSAREAFPSVASAFRELLREREVVLVDQRGTGGSHPIECRPPGGEATSTADFADPAGARRFAAECLEGLDADPRFYTTSDAVLDLEAVRDAIGAERVNLVGISYGTRVALEYLRREPGRVP
jgi:pimeloyl-ACP methyl ester carboxylesterase